ncbi:F-box protein SKIP5 isoform X3 [Amborella trichopoda]|uniref:F-box protein SKIP5 isoform X3 n=1 Tax=Amborella trichopoda TaxID=13333 RepID=UPI0005D3BC80|nr:F-box protein SKIP5 isoform X3 [Amborella trichopoda]|eukprot:XP_011629404.1 F-box protein SKIP5 isoform X3 [Amborella trichopoda]
MEEKQAKGKRAYCSSSSAPVNALDDGCLMHIFALLSPIPDRYNTALVCRRWRFLACHPRLWLRVEGSVKSQSDPGVFPNLDSAILAARPGDTILISAGEEEHVATNIQIKKPLCLMGGGDLPDDTILVSSRGSDSALEFLSTCKCIEHPLDHLSCPIVSTAGTYSPVQNGVSVARTRIEGGAKAVLTSGSLVLHSVRVLYARTSLYFWFDVSQKPPISL